jgi:hypothetical protein
MGITPEAIGDAIRRSGHQIDGDIASISVLFDIALLNFNLSRLVISSPKMAGVDTRISAVPGTT